MSVPQDTSKNHPASGNKEQKPSFKFDVAKSLLSSNQDNGQSVFSFKPQQLLQSPPHTIQVAQPKTSATNIQVVQQPIASTNNTVQKLTTSTILIRAQSPTTAQKQVVKPQLLINHPNVKIQESPVSQLSNAAGLRKVPSEITMKNQSGHTVLLHPAGTTVKQIQQATQHKKIIVPPSGSGTSHTKIYQIPCSTQKAINKQPVKIVQSGVKETSKLIPILPKPDTQKIVVQQQILLPSTVIVQSASNQQMKPNLISIPVTGPSFMKYNVSQHSTPKWNMPSVSNISMPALAPIQPKVSITATQPKIVSAPVATTVEKNDNLKIIMDPTEYANSTDSEMFDEEFEESENIESSSVADEKQQEDNVAKILQQDKSPEDEQQFLDVKRIIEGDDGLQMIQETPDKNSSVDTIKDNYEENDVENTATNTLTCTTTTTTTKTKCITTKNNNTNSNTNNSILLCDEQIASITPEESPENSDKPKDQTTPMHSNDEIKVKNKTIEDVKKNLKLDLISAITHDNNNSEENEKRMEIDESESIMSDDQSNQSSMTEQHKKITTDDSPSKMELLSTEEQATSSKSGKSKPKRSRKPKNPTVNTSLGLPYKPPQPSSRKKKVEKKIELEMDFHDPLNKILWEDGIGGLNNCNKLFGFNEFGLIEVLNKKDATAKLKLYEETPSGGSVDNNHNFKFRKIDDPQDQFVCVVCSKLGTVRDFFSPECCSESCFAITKRKTMEFNSSGKDEHNDSGVNTPTDVKKIMFEGELITLQQLHQQLLEQQLPDSNKKNEKQGSSQKRISSGALEIKFTWDTYLTSKSVPAPENLFIYTSKTATTHFRVGMKLEAIDPRNQHMICVCTVEEKLGCRMKLHFDGYPATYDFWTNSDSFNIFPTEFCQTTGRKLNVPPRWNNKKFDWSEYFDHTNSVGAQRYMFPRLVQSNEENPLTVRMKLEVKHEDNWYAATIIDVINSRILIRFDGIYENIGCFWFDINSPYLNACDGHKTLENASFKSPFMPTTKPFDWTDYLISTGATGAPKDFFTKNKRKPYQFEPGMKLEIVDKVNPQLIRPATVLCQNEYKIQVIFDGFDIKYAYWLDDDSEDIHPINYCKQTEHPIEHPAGGTKMYENSLCSMNGCRGIGNGLFIDRYFHDNQKECPYNIENFNRLMEQRENTRLDYKPYVRRNKTSANTQRDSVDKSRSLLLQNATTPPASANVTPVVKYKKENKEVELKDESMMEDEIPAEVPKPQKGRPKKRKLMHPIIKVQREEINDEENDEHKSAKIRIVKHFLDEYGPQMNYAYNLWTKNSKVLDKATITDEDLTDNPLKWSVDDVCTYLVKFCDEETTAKFYAQKIDGEALLMICQKDLVTLLDIKVGPAVKIYNRILWLRQLVMTKFTEF